MTTCIFTGLIIKSAWAPGWNGGSFPKLTPKHCTLGRPCACALGLILTIHIWASVGLFLIRIWWIPYFPMYHPQIIYKSCDSSAMWFTGMCKLCEGKFTLGPPSFPVVPLPLIPAPFASFTPIPTASDPSLLWVLPCPPHLWFCVVCEKPSGDAFSNVSAF